MPKILLVEDNELNRDMLSRRLKRRDYDVEMAVDGQEGVDLTRSLMPDLVLMDMSLPIIDGWTATGILKRDSSTSHIPIIALTAHAMEGERQKCLEAGCDDFDTKPIEFKRLLEKINHWIEISSNKKIDS
jgi:CheY-like chemotaxis protein